MVEKVFNKCYPIGVNGVPQRTLTRAANRLIADYIAAFGGFYIPDEIKTIAKQIKIGEIAEGYNWEHEHELNGTGEKIYDKVKYTNEARARAYFDNDEYGDPMYCVDWYFFSSEHYKKRIGGVLLRANTYHDIYKKVTAAKGNYRYFCTHRPPSSGGIPSGYISYDAYSSGQNYLGEVTYNAPLKQSDLENWGLVLDTNWSDIRAALLGEEGNNGNL